jgi:hypothetical protein
VGRGLVRHCDETAVCPEGWKVKMGVFVLEKLMPRLEQKLNGIEARITALDECSPWKYRDWDRDR